MKRMFFLGLTVLSVFAADVVTPAASAYWCPSYTWYCSRDSQCRGYCGAGVPADWEVCSQGCCACRG